MFIGFRVSQRLFPNPGILQDMLTIPYIDMYCLFSPHEQVLEQYHEDLLKRIKNQEINREVLKKVCYYSDPMKENLCLGVFGICATKRQMVLLVDNYDKILRENASKTGEIIPEQYQPFPYFQQAIKI